jgi:hypothetical protein
VFNYSSGIRDNESEYVATFIGTKVAFESRDQVKFFYGNTTDVVDNETNLSMRDAIYLSYEAKSGTNSSSTTTADAVTIGQAPITGSTNYSTNGADFFAKFQHTGARESYNYTESGAVTNTKYTHSLISSDGNPTVIQENGVWISGVTLLAPTDPPSPNGLIIGDVDDSNSFGVDKLKIRIDDLTTLSSQGTDIQLGAAVSASTDTNLSNTTIAFTGGNQVNATSAFTTISTAQLGGWQFKGIPSITYFAAAANKGSGGQNITDSKWVFSDPEVGVSPAREQDDMTITYPGTPDEYTFTLAFHDPTTWNNVVNVSELDQDIKFKQYPYGEITEIGRAHV